MQGNMAQVEEACLGLPEDALPTHCSSDPPWQGHRCSFSFRNAFISMTSRRHWTQKEGPLGEPSAQALQ